MICLLSEKNLPSHVYSSKPAGPPRPVTNSHATEGETDVIDCHLLAEEENSGKCHSGEDYR